MKFNGAIIARLSIGKLASGVLLGLTLSACSQQDGQQSSVSFLDDSSPQQSAVQPQQQLGLRPPVAMPAQRPAAPVYMPPPLRVPSYGDPRPAQVPQAVNSGIYAQPGARGAARIVIPPSAQLTPPSNVMVQSHLSMLKPDPRCEPFRARITAAGANGALDPATIGRFVQILQTADASGCVKQS